MTSSMNMASYAQSTTQQESGEVDTNNLTIFLQRLEIAIMDCQSQISVAVDTAEPDYLKYCGAIDSLAADLNGIKSDINKLEIAVSKPLDGMSRIATIELDIDNATKRLVALRKTADVLESILNIRQLLTQFDSALDNYHLDIASDAIRNASLALQSISPHLTTTDAMPELKEPEQRSTQHAEDKTGGVRTGMAINDIKQTNSNSSSCEDDLYLARYLKSQILDRRSRLSYIVCAMLDSLFKFFPHGVEVSLASSTTPGNPNSMTLEQIWHALKGTPFLNDKMAYLVSSLIDSVIEPVILAAAKTPRGRMLTSRTLTTGGALRHNGNSTDSRTLNETWQQQPRRLNSPLSAVWSWLEVSYEVGKNNLSHSNNLSSQQQHLIFDNLNDIERPTFLLLDVLESLFEFISSHFFSGHPDLLEQLGNYIYPDLTLLLKEKLGQEEVPTIVLDRLRDFETKLKALCQSCYSDINDTVAIYLDLIPHDVKTLALFCQQHDKVIFETRRTTMLCEVRRLCITVDPAVVAVGDQSHDDTMVSNLNDIIQLLQADSNKESTDDASLQTIIRHLRESPLILPQCYVSRGAYDTISMVDHLLKDILNRIKVKGVDDHLFDPAIQTIRDVVSLFLFLRSSLHRAKLYNDALYAAVFYCDVLFISRRILLLLPTVEKDFPSILQAKQSQLALLDLIHIMRPVQEEVFNTMLIHQRDNLLTLCRSLGSLTHLSLDADYMTAEGQIGDVIQFLKSLAISWLNVLPADLTNRCLGRLVDTFITSLLSQICIGIEETKTNLEDMNALSFLLASTRDQLIPILTIVPNTTEHYTETWTGFCLFKDLLDADVPEFIARKQEIKENLSLQQIQTVLAMNGRKTLPTHELLELIAV